MKKALFKKAVAAVLAATTILTVVPVRVSAAWTQNYYGDWNWVEGSSRAIGWKSINGNWYYFDYSGNLKTGWINDWGCWYYTNANGIMQTGVVEIDGKVYVFASDGIMQTGEISIDGQSYEFNQNGEAIGNKAPNPNKSFDANNKTLVGSFKPPYTIEGESWGSDSSTSNSSKDDFDDMFDDVKEIKVRFKVTFDSNGGSKVSSVTGIKSGHTIDLPDEPTRSGYEFDGWYKDDDDFEKEFTDDTKVRSDIKLHAKWVKEDSSSDSGSGSDSDNDSNQDALISTVLVSNDAGKDTIKVTSKGRNYDDGAKAKVELFEKTNQTTAINTQIVDIGSNGEINYVFTGVAPGTYIVKVSIGKGSAISKEIEVISSSDAAKNDVEKAKDVLSLGNINNITSNLNLPKYGIDGTSITWETSNSNIIKNTGEVTRQNGNGSDTVKLTATISKTIGTEKTEAKKEFTVTVLQLNEELIKVVEDINTAIDNSGDESEKIKAVKNSLESNYKNLAITESEYSRYTLLQIAGGNQKYQLEVAKAVYNSGEKYTLDEAGAQAIKIKFNMEVGAQATAKKADEDKVQADKNLEEARHKLTDLINEQYTTNAGVRITLKEDQDKNTKESWTRYIEALEKAKDAESDDRAILSDITKATDNLNSSREALTGAYLVTINLYKNGKDASNKWSDFKDDITLQKGSLKPISAEHVGESAYKATLTKGEYKILVDGKETGKKIIITDSPVEENLYYYTVKFEMKNSDTVIGRITAKYGNSTYGYSEVKCGEAILNVPGNDLILKMDASSNDTNEFTYLWTNSSGAEESKFASYSISDFETHGKVDVICEVTPNELVINNIKGIPANDNSGNATVMASVYKYDGNQDVKVELIKDGIVVAAKSTSANPADVKIDNGNLEAKFTGLEKGVYKTKVTIGSLERESLTSFYINKMPQELLDAINAINEAIKNNAGDSTYRLLREIFESEKFNEYSVVLGLNKTDYGKLIESTNKYTTEVAKAVYTPLGYTVNDIDTIKKAFNDAVSTQLKIKQADDVKTEGDKNLKDAKDKLTAALDEAMEKDRVTWKKISTEYTEDSWIKYESSVISAIKVEQNEKSTIAQMTSATNTLIAAESDLKKGYEATINVTKDGIPSDGFGAITLKKQLTSVSLGNAIQATNVAIGTVKTKRLENGDYEIFVNGVDTGEMFKIYNAPNSTTTLNYYTFNFNLTGSSSIDISGSTVKLNENNIKTNTTKDIISGSAVLKGNNVTMTVTPKYLSGISGTSEFVYKWTGKDDDVSKSTTQTATAYSIGSKLDINCDIKAKNPVIINISPTSDEIGKVTITGKVDCESGKQATAELLKNSSSLSPQVIKNNVAIGGDGSFTGNFIAPESGTYTVKVTVDATTKTSNSFTVTIK